MMNNEVYNHYLIGMTPDEIAQHFKDICPEFSDLNVEEVLLMQESAFDQYIQTNKRNKDTISAYGETSNSSSVSAHENESSHGTSVENQLALDEALARALELGDDFNNFHIHEPIGVSAVDNTRSTVREPLNRRESRNIRQDEIDPDRMTYEELQSLGESVGRESRGLSADLVSRLPTFNYKIGLFSKKKKEKEECVICCAGYKNGATLMALPCAHRYHSCCITRWLQQNKQCPICFVEVKDM